MVLFSLSGFLVSSSVFIRIVECAFSVLGLFFEGEVGHPLRFLRVHEDGADDEDEEDAEGQEEGNVTYVMNNNAGAFVESPQSIAQTVQTWLSQNELLRELTDNAASLARPRASLDIADDLLGWV